MAAVSAPALATTHHHKGTKIATRHIAKYGRVLANSKGRVMYLFANDGHKVSHCNGACASIWPRVTSETKPRAGAGISAKHLSRTAKHDQVTYYGHPLYYFTGDAKPGQARGENTNSFFVVSTHGKAIKPKKHTTPAGPTGPAEVTTDMAGGVEVITSKDSHTLYALDPNELPSFSCVGSCTSVWLPLLTKGAPTASGDAMASLLSTVTRPDGSTQVTYNGYPVYNYQPDTAPGQDMGQAHQGPYLNVWYDLTPAGPFNL
jgi:predicted lipoprotein with Yx(FWY)xxD motif